MELWKNITSTIYGAVPDDAVPKDLQDKMKATQTLQAELDVAERNLKDYQVVLLKLANSIAPVVNDMVQLGLGDSGNAAKEAVAMKDEILDQNATEAINLNLSDIDSWRKSLGDLVFKLEEQKKLEIELHGLQTRVRASAVSAERNALNQRARVIEAKRDGMAAMATVCFDDLVKEKRNRGHTLLARFSEMQKRVFEKGNVMAKAIEESVGAAQDTATAISREEGKVSKSKVKESREKPGRRKKGKKKKEKKVETDDSSSNPDEPIENAEGETSGSIDENLLVFDNAMTNSLKSFMSSSENDFTSFDPLGGSLPPSNAPVQASRGLNPATWKSNPASNAPHNERNVPLSKPSPKSRVTPPQPVDPFASLGWPQK